MRERAALVLQAALVLTVVGWVLDLPRSWFGLGLYTEQFLVTVLGFALALAFLPRAARWWDAAAGALGLALCLYVAWRYPALQLELTSRPLAGVLLAAALAALVLEGTRRTAGAPLVMIVLVGCVYALFGEHLPGIFQSRPVQFTRLLVYEGLDTNARAPGGRRARARSRAP